MDAIEKTNPRVILLDPAGRTFNQTYAEELSKEDQLIFICGHYEGYDERIKTLVTDEISLGDYVLTGGELAAMTMIDATVRLIPEVIGKEASHTDDSFSSGLLEYPQYTRPYEYRGMVVPDVLMRVVIMKIFGSGDWNKVLEKPMIDVQIYLACYQLSDEERFILDKITSRRQLDEFQIKSPLFSFLHESAVVDWQICSCLALQI